MVSGWSDVCRGSRLRFWITGLGRRRGVTSPTKGRSTCLPALMRVSVRNWDVNGGDNDPAWPRSPPHPPLLTTGRRHRPTLPCRRPICETDTEETKSLITCRVNGTPSILLWRDGRGWLPFAGVQLTRLLARALTPPIYISGQALSQPAPLPLALFSIPRSAAHGSAKRKKKEGEGIDKMKTFLSEWNAFLSGVGRFFSDGASNAASFEVLLLSP